MNLFFQCSPHEVGMQFLFIDVSIVQKIISFGLQTMSPPLSTHLHRLKNSAYVGRFSKVGTPDNPNKPGQ